MNVYRIEYTHHWIGEPPEVLTWHVLGGSVDEALETWRVSGHLGGELKDKEPDSIACLGEAILPEGSSLEGDPPAQQHKDDPTPSIPVPGMFQCSYCGAWNSQPYRGPCPQCPPQGLRREP